MPQHKKQLQHIWDPDMQIMPLVDNADIMEVRTHFQESKHEIDQHFV